MDDSLSRRRLLGMGGATLAGLLAGCSGLGGGNQNLPKGLLKSSVAGGFGNRHVDCITFTESGAHLLDIPRAGIERCRAMDIEEANIGIGPENILCPIAMVSIPVDNQDAFTS